MSKHTQRAAEIRSFTKPQVPVSLDKVRQYADAAARWEDLRKIMARGSSTPAQDEQFLVLSEAVRSHAAELQLPVICTEGNANEDGIPGCSDRNGFLSKDPARILFDSWSEAYLDRPRDRQRMLNSRKGRRAANAMLQSVHDSGDCDCHA